MPSLITVAVGPQGQVNHLLTCNMGCKSMFKQPHFVPSVVSVQFTFVCQLVEIIM